MMSMIVCRKIQEATPLEKRIAAPAAKSGGRSSILRGVCWRSSGSVLGGGAFEPWLNEYSTTTPACATASSPEDVQQALARTEELNAIRSAAKNVEFSQTLLCDGQKAVLTITYTDRSDFKRLNDVVTSAQLGAAAEIKLKR